MPPSLSLLVLFAAVPQAPVSQAPRAPAAPGDVLAHGAIAGRDVAITRTDTALEMAFHLRRREEGVAGCEHLVDTALVRAEAQKLGVTPTAGEVKQFWNAQLELARAAGEDLRAHPIVRNSTEAEWLELLAVTMAHERIVRGELGSKPDEPVGPEMLRLWTKEARKRHEVELDPNALPLGAAARVDGREIPLVELGLLLLRKSDDAERDRFVRQFAYRKALDAACAANGVEATQEELQQEIARRRSAAARDPRWQGLGFEQILKSQGLTAATLAQSHAFRAQVQLSLLAQKLLPDDALAREIATDRQGVLDVAGPRRRLGLVFARALEPPNKLVPRDFAAATAHLAKVKERLAKETFENTARIESDDPASKARGGDLGWLQRKTNALPDAVLAAAFAAAKNDVLEPIPGPDGVYLVKVLDAEPDPSDAELLVRLRELRSDELGRKLLRDVALRRPDGKPFDAEDGPREANGARGEPGKGGG